MEIPALTLRRLCKWPGHDGTGRRRDADTLLPVIQSTVAACSIIWSDRWRAYNDLGYAHQTVNHSQQFVAANGVNTHIIEGCWSLCKQ